MAQPVRDTRQKRGVGAALYSAIALSMAAPTSYSATEPYGVRNLNTLLTNRVTLPGFIVKV